MNVGLQLNKARGEARRVVEEERVGKERDSGIGGHFDLF